MTFVSTQDIDATQTQASQPFMLGAEHHEQTYKSNIAEVAYFKAENRGFIPGYELDDWLSAERECNLS
jgi:hypothetical protein